MIAYCTYMSLKKCTNALSLGYHGTKLRMITSVVVTKKSKKGLPAKVLWYLLIIPRFKRLFANEDNAKDLT